jgi:hypothetical protein
VGLWILDSGGWEGQSGAMVSEPGWKFAWASRVGARSREFLFWKLGFESIRPRYARDLYKRVKEREMSYLRSVGTLASGMIGPCFSFPCLIKLVGVMLLVGLAVVSPVAGGVIPAGSVELQFRSHAEVTEPVVKVGDLAYVRASSPEEARWVEQHELFPAPRPGGARLVTRQEIIETLLRRGFSRRQLFVSGAPQTLLVTSRHPIARELGTRASNEEPTLPSKEDLQSSPLVREGTGVPPHLRAVTPEPARRDSDMPGTPTSDNQFPGGVSLASGHLGRAAARQYQEHGVFISGDSGSSGVPIARQGNNLPLDPRHGASTLVTASAQTVSRGQGTPGEASGIFSDVRNVVPDLSDVRSAVPDGVSSVKGERTTGTSGTFPSRYRQDRLVNRGDVVTVWVRGPNVQVKTVGKARQDGQLGDTVLIEAPSQRGLYSARVCGPRTVEIVIQPELAR